MLQRSGQVNPAGVRCLESLIREQVLRSAVYLDSTGSTNSLALADLNALLASDDKLPRLYLTDVQTAGRGRMGRTWSSEDDSLTFSVMLKLPLSRRSASAQRSWPAQRSELNSVPLSILAGVTTAEAIDAFVSPTVSQLKWPNDIYIEGQKVAGILVEANGKHPDIAVLGIGVNMQTSPTLYSLNTAMPASLALFTPHGIDRFDLLDEILRRLFAEDTSHSLIERFRQKCYLTGQRISLDQSGSPVEGACEGIDVTGCLIVNSGDQVHKIHSGEATLVRRR